MPTVSDQLLAQLEPYLGSDGQNGSDLAAFLGAVALMYEQVREWADDDDDGNVGWSILLDITRAPSEALPWLGQFVGAEVDPNFSDPGQRDQIVNVQGWARGSVAALRQAALPFLTGNQTVMLSERDPGASPVYPEYGLIIYTRASETPDPDAVEAALFAIKPAGIVMLYKTVAGQIYQDIYLNYATYGDVYTAFGDYQELLLHADIVAPTPTGSTYGPGQYGPSTYGG